MMAHGVTIALQWVPKPRKLVRHPTVPDRSPRGDQKRMLKAALLAHGIVPTGRQRRKLRKALGLAIQRAAPMHDLTSAPIDFGGLARKGRRLVGKLGRLVDKIKAILGGIPGKGPEKPDVPEGDGDRR